LFDLLHPHVDFSHASQIAGEKPTESAARSTASLRAFHDLEPALCDLPRMALIMTTMVENLIHEHSDPGKTNDTLSVNRAEAEAVVLSVTQFRAMTDLLKDQYYSAWHPA
jgi:hypothetical protein